jgi:hypothetical protein
MMQGRSETVGRRGVAEVSMPARAFVIRFPNGDYEYDVGRRAAPTIGDTVRRRGVLWSVTKITQDTVVTLHVERADAPAAQPVQSSVPREARSVSRQAE